MNAPWKSGGGNGRDQFAAYICDEASLDVLRPVAMEMGWQPEKCNKGGLRNAFPLLPTRARARATASCDGRGCSSSSGLHRNPLLMHHQWEDVVLVGFSSVDESDIAYCMDLATECC